MPTSEPPILLRPGFIADDLDLYDELVAGVQWDERMRSRKTASFGASYDYSGISYAAVPMHPRLVAVVDAIEDVVGYRSNNCLINFYPDGSSTMGFHSDAEAEIEDGTGVAIVSLGSERSIVFRSKEDKSIERSYALPSGSFLYMPPGMQSAWKHAIPASENTGGRISLTFRLMREKR